MVSKAQDSQLRMHSVVMIGACAYSAESKGSTAAILPNSEAADGCGGAYPTVLNPFRRYQPRCEIEALASLGS